MLLNAWIIVSAAIGGKAPVEIARDIEWDIAQGIARDIAQDVDWGIKLEIVCD